MTVDEYLNDVPEAQRKALERIRKIAKKTALHDIEELITYGMPGMKYKKKYLIGYCQFKDHMSLFPGAYPIDEVEEDLKGFKLSKGTIQFTLEKEVPEHVIEKLLRARIKQIDAATR